MAEKGLISEKTELIEGVVVDKMSKSPIHASLTRLIHNLLAKALPDGWSVQSEQPLSINQSEPEPDIAIISGADKDYIVEHPKTAELVIEISQTTVAYDRDKADIYAQAKIPRYVIINLENRQVEEFSKPDGTRYLESKTAPLGTLALWEGIEIDLSKF